MRVGAALAVVGVLAAAGCGSEAKQPLSAAAYGQAAGRICIAQQSVPVSPAAYARDAQAYLDRLRALVPPRSRRALATRWIAAMEASHHDYSAYLAARRQQNPRERPIFRALVRRGALIEQLATELGATGCTLRAIGEGYRPYPLHEVEAALGAENLRYTDPLAHGSTYATGWTGSRSVGC